MGEAKRRMADIQALGANETERPEDAHVILDDDRPYLEVVVQNVRNAREATSQATSLEQEAVRLRTAAAAMAGSYESYMGFLSRRYGLRDGEEITDDGRIIRHDPGD